MNGANLVIYPSFISLLLFYKYICFLSSSIAISFSFFFISIYMPFLVVGFTDEMTECKYIVNYSNVELFGWLDRYMCFEAQITGSISFWVLAFNIWMDSSIYFRSQQLTLGYTNSSCHNISAPILWLVSLWIFPAFATKNMYHRHNFARK